MTFSNFVRNCLTQKKGSKTLGSKSKGYACHKNIKFDSEIAVQTKEEHENCRSGCIYYIVDNLLL